MFLPIVFTKGITRQLFVDMGLTIAYSLLAESSDGAYDRTYDVSWCVAENGGKNKRFSGKYRTYTEIFWKKALDRKKGMSL